MHIQEGIWPVYWAEWNQETFRFDCYALYRSVDVYQFQRFECCASECQYGILMFKQQKQDIHELEIWSIPPVKSNYIQCILFWYMRYPEVHVSYKELHQICCWFFLLETGSKSNHKRFSWRFCCCYGILICHIMWSQLF